MTRLVPLLLLLVTTSACNTIRPLDKDAVEPAIAQARIDLAEGRTEKAIKAMQSALVTEEVEPEVLTQARVLLEEAAAVRIEELSGDDPQPGKLAAMLDLELPRQISVEAAVRATEMLISDDDLMDGFRLIKKLDRKYPTHHLRADVGRLLADIGLGVAARKGNYLLFFSRSQPAKEVLDYLVLNYPSERRCDVAYATLADLHVDDERWELAIEAHQNLLLYHPDSPLALESEAAIPKLRLTGITSPEYDRRELLRARGELEAWLERHPDSELDEEVRLDLAEAYLRLYESDMGIARFYRRVDNPYGARFHAGRAVEEARMAGDEGRVERAEAFLAKVPAETDAEPEPLDPTEALPTDDRTDDLP